MHIAAIAGFFFGAFIMGSILTALILRLLLCKYRDTLPGVYLAVTIALTISTVVGGYGFQDEAPDPVFLETFMKYVLPLMAVLVVELSLLTRRVRAGSAS